MRVSVFKQSLVIGLLLGDTNSNAQDAVKPPATTPQWVVLNSTKTDLITMTIPRSDFSNLVPYTINIPIDKTNSDGKVESTFRTEIRWRQRNNPEKEALLSETLTWRVKALTFLDLKGIKLNFEKDVLPRLTKPMAAIAINGPSVDPFFTHILKEDTLVVVVPAL